MRIPVDQMDHAADLPFPAYAGNGAAHFDLFAALPDNAPILINSFERCLVPTGIRFALPVGYEAQVRPCPVLASDYGVSILNNPGTIDQDYRGEIKVLLINLGSGPVKISRGMCIAQCVISAFVCVMFDQCVSLSDSARAEKGFGSTGLL